MNLRQIINLLSLFSISITLEAQTLYPNISGNEHIDIDLHRQQWYIVNDTVMGGRSTSAVNRNSEGVTFSGTLSLDNNGGFASVRLITEQRPLQAGHPINVTLRGDGRVYQFRLRTTATYDGVAYTKSFKTVAGKTLTLSFNESDFTPVWRGRRVTNASDLKFNDVKQVGFMLADKQPGEFRLTIDKIQQQH